MPLRSLNPKTLISRKRILKLKFRKSQTQQLPDLHICINHTYHYLWASPSAHQFTIPTNSHLGLISTDMHHSCRALNLNLTHARDKPIRPLHPLRRSHQLRRHHPWPCQPQEGFELIPRLAGDKINIYGAICRHLQTYISLQKIGIKISKHKGTKKPIIANGFESIIIDPSMDPQRPKWYHQPDRFVGEVLPNAESFAPPSKESVGHLERGK